MRPVRASLLALLAVLPALAACGDDSVLLTFRPRVGTTYDYDVEVRSVTTRRVAGSLPDVAREEARFRARHTVLDAGDDGIRVRVELRRPGSDPRTFVVRYDRAAQLEAVESIEGIPVAALSGLGLAEIFPAAAGAPPDRPLSPGDRWTIDETVQLTGADEPRRLRGSGRLAELGVVDGRDVARLVTSSTLPVGSSSVDGDIGVVRGGTLTTSNRAEHDLANGSVRRIESRTRGRVDLVLEPPPGVVGASLPGTLDVDIESETRRV